MLINESNLLDDIVYGLLKICDMFPEVFGILVNVCVGLPLDLKTSGDLLLGLDTNLSNQLRKLRNNPTFSALKRSETLLEAHCDWVQVLDILCSELNREWHLREVCGGSRR